MSSSPSRSSSQSQLIDRVPNTSSMSVAVQTHLQTSLLSAKEMSWQHGIRPVELPSRTRSPPEKIELPSIRHMLPEIGLGNGRNEEDYRADSRLSPNAPSTGSKPSRSAPAEYPNSPSSNKRRRLSSEEETESEQRDVVGSRFRGWSPSHHTQRPQSAAISPRSADRRISAFSSPESWATQSQPSRSSPYMTSAQNPSRHSPPYESSRPEWPARPTLPSLQTLTQTTAAPRARSSFNEYALDSSRANVQAYPQISAASFDPPVSYHPQVGFAYGYQQPRGQSYSGPSSYALAHDRTPFSASAHHGYTGGGYAYGVDASEGDNKQRKRRGNLPKETTDKLRAWFVAHLQHPYPTEDEKQELMRQTGLQMNQISNWFINARRRQLPAMINNARAESDARSARPGPGDSVDYQDDEQRGRGGSRDSDGDASPYPGLENESELRRNGITIGLGTKRESI